VGLIKMKLLIITAIKEFEKEIKHQLKNAKVNTFLYQNTIGYRDSTMDVIESNWFSTEMNKSESILFYAFVKKENVETLFETINEFNAKQETLSQIHVAVLAIEKSN
jgi:pyruvate/oxaloacetate carboxyltransferase